MKIFDIILLGCSATLFMDLYNFILKKLFGIRSLDYRLVGRWLLYLPQGQLFHHTIIQTPAIKSELMLGWLVHYLIGILFAVIFIACLDQFDYPTFLLAIGFGVFTVIIPFFLMQPCFGFGIASNQLVHPWKLRFKSLGNHIVFGLGLYLSIQLLYFTH
ncbi:DUF2938 domain-containing protein [Acinetobacter guerrae]|uniref:DUF2938 domain-containing protein n=1 Tax=Acinetobacter guerrae TaxID=1843371 RepID=A0A3A8F695_9GAMM|nr:DUF2938 domain-containing protein [Acinetobacter guerrae]RKG36263.1 DUF2938 domain-containing protein [Acinetobacter guerrae]